MSENSRIHVMVGMSGGVDSSVAAMLLRDQDYRVTGMFMKNWEEDDSGGYCAAAEDLADAETVCAKLGIPLRTVNFSHEYWTRVFSRFLAEYDAGRTPNPDVLCNREIKFREFLDHARTLGADLIATGHYAGLTQRQGRQELRRARDPGKDQSYFLHALDQQALRSTLFPLADRNKSEVRHLAEQAGLPVHAKKDSTGICFIGERRFKEFLQSYLRPRPGEIRSIEGRLLGQHDGLMYHTIGQRQGLGIGGPGGPWYVAAKDTARNILYVAQGQDHPSLLSQWLRADQLSWIAGAPPRLPHRCTAKTRYRQLDQPCLIEPLEQGAARVRFDQAQRAVAPGQAVVFYEGDVCLGGGTILDSEALSERFGDAAA
jgi:tRNA-specific 2-thiouridylase